jgi:hypothetical protein
MAALGVAAALLELPVPLAATDGKSKPVASVNLLQVARPVATLHRGANESIHFAWATNKTIWVFTTVEDTTVPIRLIGRLDTVPGACRIDEIDVDTGARKKLPALSEVYDKHSQGYPRGESVAPDASRILWVHGPENDVKWSVTDFAGRLLASGTARDELTLAGEWLPDGSGWCELKGNRYFPQLNIYTTNPVVSSKTVELERLREMDLVGRAGESWAPFLYGVDRKLCAYAYALWAPEAKQVVGFKVNNSRQVESRIISVPDGRQVNQVLLSPSCHSLLWCCIKPEVRPGQIDYIVPFEFWLSDWKGANLRRIGCLDVVYKQPLYYKGEPWNVAWRPDGKALMFMVNDTLYTVELDKLSARTSSSEN